jgi:type VI secretion system secreted protein VgrG
MQSAAGKGFGTVFNPRIGQEVAVSFLEGDPDRPIVTGSVYNAERPLPFGGPETKTMTGIRSRSIGGGPQNFNELRMEDKAGKELLFMQAERDMKTWVKNDQDETVENDRLRRVGRDEKLQIKHDQALELGNDQVIQIGHNTSLTVGNQIRLVVGSSSITMKKDGTIIIDGVDVYVNGAELNLRGSREMKYDSDNITGIARTSHKIRGATLQHNP